MGIVKIVVHEYQNHELPYEEISQTTWVQFYSNIQPISNYIPHRFYFMLFFNQLMQFSFIWGTICAIYCDFVKAFDKVPHRRLIYKVRQMAILEIFW